MNEKELFMNEIVKTILNNSDRINSSSPTLRAVSKIPKMPKNTDNAKYLPTYNMQNAEIIDEKLIFVNGELGFNSAIKDGFFFLKIPKYFDLSSGDKFVRNFFRPKIGDSEDRYRGFKDVSIKENYQGYFDRKHDQWENFYIELSNWKEYLPPEIEDIGHKMTDIGICILKNVLKKIGIPETQLSLVTSGLSDKKGHQMLAFNHFRADKDTRGTKFHRDSGWVTVLRSTEPGLVALIGEQLFSINPKKDYFIINFGSSIEVLTQAMKTPVSASIHGVVQTVKKFQETNRTSYVVFLDSNLNGQIFRYESGNPIKVQTVKEFAIQEVIRTYDDDETKL
jgi:hypothetical protein